MLRISRGPLAKLGAATMLLSGLLVGSLGVLVGTATAIEHERIAVGEGETVKEEYPPIPGNDAAGEFTHPDNCGSTGVTCDVIPITIEPPLDAGSQFFVRISLFWIAEPDPTGASSFATNDLDMYLWHDPPQDQTVTSTPDDPATEDEDESETNNPGASGRLPERINFFSTEPGDYLLVVSNFLGPSQGYELEVRYFPTSERPPTGFGDIAQAPPAAASTGSLNGPRTVEPAAPVTPAFTPPPAAEPAATPLLPEAPVTTDEDFADFDPLDISEELAAPPDVAALTRRTAARTPPPDPSTISLVAWLGLVPLGLLVGSGALLWRRRPAALRVRAV